MQTARAEETTGRTDDETVCCVQPALEAPRVLSTSHSTGAPVMRKRRIGVEGRLKNAAQQATIEEERGRVHEDQRVPGLQEKAAVDGEEKAQPVPWWRGRGGGWYT